MPHQQKSLCSSYLCSYIADNLQKLLLYVKPRLSTGIGIFDRFSKVTKNLKHQSMQRLVNWLMTTIEPLAVLWIQINFHKQKMTSARPRSSRASVWCNIFDEKICHEIHDETFFLIFKYTYSVEIMARWRLRKYCEKQKCMIGFFNLWFLS